MKICEHLKSGRAALVAAASILLVVLVWVLFRQTGVFEFLRLDDHDYTYRCAFVKDGLSWANVREAFTNVRHGGIWMPATYISYMCDITLFGPGAGTHHLVNVAIHALNAVLLLWLLVVLATKNTKITEIVLFLLAALWAVHPQRAEAVAWIASRKELLCATFILGGLLCWLRARRREGWGRIPALVGTYTCLILACMSKPTAMCFPFLVLAVEGILHSTTDDRHPADIRQSASASPHFAFYTLHFTLFLFLAVATGALAVYSQTHPEGHAVRELFSASLPWRILNAAVAVGLYVFQMVVPVGIHLDYRAVPGGWPVQGALGLGVLAVLAAGAWWWCRRIRRRAEQDQAFDRAGLFLMGAVILWFFAALAPTLGIFGSFGEHARADRFLYLPAMALPIAGVLLYGARGARAISVRPPRRGGPTAGTTGILPVAGLAAIVAVFFAVAYPVVTSYRTDMTAFTRTLAVDPDNWRALAHVGEAKCAAGELDEGIDMLRKSRTVLARNATDGKLAYALMRRGRADDWGEITNVCAAVASDPSRDARGQALEALGTAELVGRDWHSAALHLLLSIQAPGRHYSSADAILKLAFAQHNGGRRAEARKLFEWVRDSSGREDLAKRAREVLSVLEYSPRGMLFW
ncbi:MAG: hypothetical protein IJQ00_13765 [Kiritimatiellae bacterium]|nr:hypothetical protein [Kiritimatiellia bacterium]